MNTKRTIFGLSIILLFIASTAAADYSGSCCEWGKVSLQDDPGCIGNCASGLTCREVAGAFQTCACQTPLEDCGWIDYLFVSPALQSTEGYCGGTCPTGMECVGGSRECWCDYTSSTTTPTTTSSTTTTTLSSCEQECKRLDYQTGYCDTYAVVPGVYSCSNGGEDIGPFGDCSTTPGTVGAVKTCCCGTTTTTTLVSVPEFGSNSAALLILLTCPAFAYLAARRRH